MRRSRPAPRRHHAAAPRPDNRRASPRSRRRSRRSRCRPRPPRQRPGRRSPCSPGSSSPDLLVAPDAWARADRGPAARRTAPPALTALSALQQAGMYVYAVRARHRVHRRTTAEFRVRPAIPTTCAEVFETLRGRGVTPAWLVHATTLPGWEPVTARIADRQLDDSFFSLLALVQRAGRALADQPAPGLLVLTVAVGRRVRRRSGRPGQGHPARPGAQPAAGGAAGVRVPCWMSVPGRRRTDLAEEVRTVLAGDRRGGRGAARGPPVGAPRGAVPADRRGHHSVRRQGRVPHHRRARRPRPGGRGRSGAYRPAAGPVLAGRHGLPEGDELTRALADGDPRVTRLHAAVEELEMLGARVRVLACDVSDARGLRPRPGRHGRPLRPAQRRLPPGRAARRRHAAAARPAALPPRCWRPR